MTSNTLFMILYLILKLVIVRPVKSPPRIESNTLSHSNTDLLHYAGSKPFNTNQQPSQEQKPPIFITNKTLKTRKQRTPRNKEQIKLQTKKRAERKKIDPEFKIKVAKQQSKSYHKNKWKKTFNLSQEEIKAKNQESLNKRKEKYGGYTSSKEQKYYETKARMYDGYPVTQEDREFVEQYRKKRAELSRDYKLRQQINKALSSMD